MSPGGRRRRESGAGPLAGLPATVLLGVGIAAGLLVAVLLLAGCSSDDGDRLTVAAASSLRPAFGDPGESDPGGGPVRFTFGGSDLLAGQIRQGAGIDVIAAASTIQPEQLFEDGLVGRPVEFAGNRLVVGVPGDSAIDSVEDIAGPGVSLVIGDASVPIGIYAREMISMLPAATAAQVRSNVRSQEQDATSITAKLAQGAADAGIVYETDVISAGDQLRAVEIPDELQPRIAYSAAVVSSTSMPEQAEAFIESLLSGERAGELRKAGLLPPP